MTNILFSIKEERRKKKLSW